MALRFAWAQPPAPRSGLRAAPSSVAHRASSRRCSATPRAQWACRRGPCRHCHPAFPDGHPPFPPKPRRPPTPQRPSRTRSETPTSPGRSPPRDVRSAPRPRPHLPRETHPEIPTSPGHHGRPPTPRRPRGTRPETPASPGRRRRSWLDRVKRAWRQSDWSHHGAPCPYHRRLRPSGPGRTARPARRGFRAGRRGPWAPPRVCDRRWGVRGGGVAGSIVRRFADSA
jgi:hypothetical protein